MIQHVQAQVVTIDLRVPLGSGQQALHLIWSVFTDLFSYLPAVLAFDRA